MPPSAIHLICYTTYRKYTESGPAVGRGVLYLSLAVYLNGFIGIKD